MTLGLKTYRKLWQTRASLKKHQPKHKMPETLTTSALDSEHKIRNFGFFLQKSQDVLTYTRKEEMGICTHHCEECATNSNEHIICTKKIINDVLTFYRHSFVGTKSMALGQNKRQALMFDSTKQRVLFFFCDKSKNNCLSRSFYNNRAYFLGKNASAS